MVKIKDSVHKLLAIFFFPCLIFIKLISPFYKIRLNILLPDRIGHLTEAAGLSLCEKIQGEKYKDIYWFNTPTCNTQLEKMVKRVFFVSWCVRYLILANNFFPSLKLVPFINKQQKGNDTEGLYFKTKDIKEAYLPFSHNEEVEAKQMVNHLGMKDSDKFVCLIVRDSKYLSTFYPKWDWIYHSHRDTNIDTYKEAIKALANLGYWVFRMGKKVKEPLDIDHPRVIDYANHEIRSDLLDIWLPTHAYFSISTSTGLDALPQAYRRPVVYVNAMTSNHFRSCDHCLWAPKYLMWESEGRLLTLKEALHSDFDYSEEYKEAGIKVVDLSSEQIKEIVFEMEGRLTGKWRATEKEELDQIKFIKILREDLNNNYIKHKFIHPEARISQKYLEYNHSFLSDN
jgi:putative glycosyltransferase (TIGR04372 family)